MTKVYNTHHHNAPSGVVYCGRGSIAGNPFVIGKDGTRDEVCDKYEKWAPKQKWWKQFLKDVRGCDLLCYCAPLRCHCDFILKESNRRKK